jgi:hypothetical protein
MTTLAEIARLIRSKNAGPFALTFDIMFEDMARYRMATGAGVLTKETVSKLYGLPTSDIDIYFCENALAVKISIPRPYAQGDLRDSDGFGGQQYAPLMDLKVA